MAIASGSLKIVAELPISPGNLTFTPDGRLICSLHQFYEPDLRVAELTLDGTLIPFPNFAWNQPNASEQKTLDSVLGIQCDRQGVVWMLDNAMRGGSTPKLVGWDAYQDQLAQVIELPAPVTLPNQFVNDLAVDRQREKIYISDPAVGDQAALIVVDLNSGSARRVLQGHQSVKPGNLDLLMDGAYVLMPQADGRLIRPHLGVNGIALDTEDEWLYYCPMHNTGVYRIRADDLANASLSDAELGNRVEQYCDNKPICDGITVDKAGNIYLGDLAANALGVINASDRSYQRLIEDERLCWLDSFAFGPDGDLYFIADQLNRSAPLHGGTNVSKPPYQILKIAPLVNGVLGR